MCRRQFCTKTSSAVSYQRCFCRADEATGKTTLLRCGNAPLLKQRLTCALQHKTPPCEPLRVEGQFMGRRKPTAKLEFVLFNVLYEDGSMSSNRRCRARRSVHSRATIQSLPSSRLRIGRSRNDRDVQGRGSSPSPERMAQMGLCLSLSQGSSGSVNTSIPRIIRPRGSCASKRGCPERAMATMAQSGEAVTDFP